MALAHQDVGPGGPFEPFLGIVPSTQYNHLLIKLEVKLTRPRRSSLAAENMKASTIRPDLDVVEDRRTRALRSIIVNIGKI